MGTRHPGTRTRLHRGVAVAAGLLAAGSLTAIAVTAGAASKPTVAQVQAKIDTLTTQFNKVSEQLDQAGAQLGSAQQQLKQVTAKWNQADTQFKAAQAAVAQIAASAYENGGSDSIAGVLTTNDPQQVLNQGALLTELSSNRDAQTQQLLSSATQLANAQQAMQRTEGGIALLKKELGSRKQSLKGLIATQQTTLDSLTTQQQQQVSSGTIGGGGKQQPVTKATDPNPASGSQANVAVAFAFSQLSCPYVYGATGPCQDGYDCSGLVMRAWQSAGIDIPRDTYSQWAALPHVSMSGLQAGDLIYYSGESHVAMYVGNGMIIDAPVPGENVEEIPLNSPWYAANEDGAVRP